jgi:xanthine/CO dehydrogenase XdhC/CoxF family maturation factor
LKHNSAVEAELTPLLPLYERERAAARAFALAVVVRTRGSTYRKPGALMAIAADGSYAGLLSGGCLENDLAEHARSVIETGRSRIVTCNTGGSDDALWGLGVGCEGAMTILLLRIGPQEHWQPLAHLAQSQVERRPTAVGVVVESSAPELAMGSVLLGRDEPGGRRPTAEARELLERVTQAGSPDWLECGGVSLFALPLALPPRLLLLGGGPDASPIVDLGGRLGWNVTVYDHRPSYAKDAHFPAAHRVVLGRPEALPSTLDLGRFEAAVVMAHHLPSDLDYLRALAASPIGYVGLLGPPHRRDRLLADLGAPADTLRERLRAPVGLDLGGRTPEAIALSIVAQIHAYLHGHRTFAGAGTTAA